MPAHRLVRSLAVASLAAGLVIAPGAGMPLVGPSAARAGTPSCASGWLDPVVVKDLSLHDVLVLSGDRTVEVGTEARASGVRRFASLWRKGSDWRTVLGPATGNDAVLLSVSGSLPGRVWAVGFRTVDERTGPLAVRWVSGRWVPDGPPSPQRGAQILSAVDVDPTGGVWAAGMAVTSRTERTALIWHRHRTGAWERYAALGVGRGTSLTAVRAIAADDVWVAGSRTNALGIRPLFLHWDGTSWEHQVISSLGPEATIAGLAGTAHESWAVGWRRDGVTYQPLVLRRAGGTWTEVPGPGFTGAYAMLTDVSIDADGRPWVVGRAYRDAADLYTPVAARFDGKAWTIWPRPPGSGRYFMAVNGDVVDGGWAIGRASSGTIGAAGCEPPPPPPAPGPGHDHVRPRDGGRHPVGPGGRPLEDESGDVTPRPVSGLRPVPALPRAVKDGSIRVREISQQVGLTGSTVTHGATVADLNGDGRRDLFISAHGSPPSLWLRVAGGYQRLPDGRFRRVDRHDCDAALIDGDAFGDVVCSVGADRGVGLKANEVWLDAGTEAVTEAGPDVGVVDPVGRGRVIALFDADGDQDVDLFLGNVGLRYDGQPTPNRLLRNDGDGTFSWDPGSGLTSDRGAWCALPRDFDHDGDLDLLVCTMSTSMGPVAGLALYENDGGHFRDVTRSLGIRPVGEIDAEIAQFDRPGRPDLVQLSRDRIRISLWSKGRFVPVYERSVVDARALAVGDVNGDGARDIFLQRGSGVANLPDVVLLNDGTGRSWKTIALPSTGEGRPDDVVALDYDDNGLTDFLVLNGSTGRGPLELFVFRRPRSSTSGR